MNDDRGIGRKDCKTIHWAVINGKKIQPKKKLIHKSCNNCYFLGYEKLVKMLIDNGIDVNAKWPGQNMQHLATPLHRAAMIGM